MVATKRIALGRASCTDGALGGIGVLDAATICYLDFSVSKCRFVVSHVFLCTVRLGYGWNPRMLCSQASVSRDSESTGHFWSSV